MFIVITFSSYSYEMRQPKTTLQTLRLQSDGFLYSLAQHRTQSITPIDGDLINLYLNILFILDIIYFWMGN